MTNSSAHESQVSLKPEKKRPTEAQMVQIQKDRNISRYVNGFILINEINQLFSNQNRLYRRPTIVDITSICIKNFHLLCVLERVTSDNPPPAPTNYK